jgi:hypothetical protein
MYRPRSQVVYASSVQFIRQVLGGEECALVLRWLCEEPHPRPFEQAITTDLDRRSPRGCTEPSQSAAQVYWRHHHYMLVWIYKVCFLFTQYYIPYTPYHAVLHLSLDIGNQLDSLLLDRTHLVGNLGRDCPISNKCTCDLVDCFLLLSGIFDFDETESFRSSESLGLVSRPSDTGNDFGGFDLDGEVGKDLGEGFIIDSEWEVSDEYSRLMVLAQATVD